MTKKIIALLLAVILAAALFAGCTGGEQSSAASSSQPEKSSSSSKAEDSKSESSEAEGPKEIVTLDVIFNLGSGLYEKLWWTDYLEEKVGVKLNVLSNNDVDISTYLAADNLPDATFFTNSIENMQIAANGGFLINFDDYKDSLPNMFNTINETALQFQRDSYGALYFLPGAASTYESNAGSTEYGMRINIPYFNEYIEANGYPELKTLDDFIPVLKWMQEQHPTNEEGQSAYGMSFFTDWDGNCINYADKFCQQTGWYSSTWPAYVNQDTLETVYAFSDDSPYLKVLKFMFNAQQAGIIDPDSLTQTWDDYQAKTAAQRTYSSYCWSHPRNNKLVMYDEYHPVSYSGPWILGNWAGAAGLGVSAKSDKIEKCLETIEFACDYDNVWYCLFGPQGEYWDLNDNGQPYVTELGLQMQQDENLEIAEGGNPAFDFPSFNLRLLSHLQTPHPVYGMTANTAEWPLLDPSSKSDIQVLWETFVKEHYGVDLGDTSLSEVALLNKLDRFATYRGEYSDPSISDEMNEILTRAKSITPEASWKMVYAANEAEFDAIWKQLQADMEAINMPAVYDYEVGRINDGTIYIMNR